MPADVLLTSDEEKARGLRLTRRQKNTKRRKHERESFLRKRAKENILFCNRDKRKIGERKKKKERGETERATHRQTDRQRKTDRQTDRGTDTDRDRVRQKERNERVGDKKTKDYKK